MSPSSLVGLIIVFITGFIVICFLIWRFWLKHYIQASDQEALHNGNKKFNFGKLDLFRVGSADYMKTDRDDNSDDDGIFQQKMQMGKTKLKMSSVYARLDPELSNGKDVNDEDEDDDVEYSFNKTSSTDCFKLPHEVYSNPRRKPTMLVSHQRKADFKTNPSIKNTPISRSRFPRKPRPFFKSRTLSIGSPPPCFIPPPPAPVANISSLSQPSSFAMSSKPLRALSVPNFPSDIRRSSFGSPRSPPTFSFPRSSPPYSRTAKESSQPPSVGAEICDLPAPQDNDPVEEMRGDNICLNEESSVMDEASEAMEMVMAAIRGAASEPLPDIKNIAFDPSSLY